MSLPLRKNAAPKPRKAYERFYLAIYFALHTILLYEFAHSSNQVGYSYSKPPTHQNQHLHSSRQARARQESGEIGDYERQRERGENDYQDGRRQQRQGHLHDRAVYMAYDHSRINSSESLSSSWFYQQDQPAILDQCCACDEAKYELVFEGLWSRYTHPDDFPENYWLAYFSDIIGASHSNDFRMWSQDSLASDGVRELAETGATKKLESELKQVSSKTRTIIKARELRYPTLNSKTSAVFRTDKQHHLVSILSKLGPSPDWMVGVSSLELCQVDCTWAAQRVVNLYLWDAGTDSGSAFMSSDSPTRPQERIHPYRRADGNAGGRVSQQTGGVSSASGSSSPSSYYDQRNQKSPEQSLGPDQFMMMPPPLVDEPSVPSSPGNNYQQGAATNTMQQQDQMKPFARLTVTRQRIYEKSCSAASNAAGESSSTYSRSSSYDQLTQQQQQQPKHVRPALTDSDSLIEPTQRASLSDCRFTDWSDWSSCSSTCGKGIRTRTRTFYDDQAHLAAGCSQSDLIEKEICLADCVGNVSCVTHDWSDWSKCSVSCGQGYRKRTRSPIGPYKAACTSVELAEMEQCTGNCEQDSADGDQAPPPSHCRVTDWSQWSECSVACGRGTKIRTRQFVRKEDLENCSNVKLLQKQSCNGRPELCKQVASKKLEDRKRICMLPAKSGLCRAKFTRWHYDDATATCKKFIYGGCMANENNFKTLQECNKACVSTTSPPARNITLRSAPLVTTEKPEDWASTCLLPTDYGPCHNNFSQWYYDKTSGTCKTFIWGGCAGNDNNFDTLDDCIEVCVLTKPKQNSTLRSTPRPPPVISTEVEDRKGICMLPAESGPCFALFEKWYYDKASSKCKPFDYGGCGGNENRFDTLEECNKACVSTTSPPAQNITLRSAPLVTTEKPEDWASTCLLPTDYGPCHNNFSQWYYDKTSGTCKTFIWGGCAGNDNNFDTLDDCIKVCVLTKPKQNSTLRSTPQPPPPVISTEVEDRKRICMLPAVKGFCRAAFTRWHYDDATATCKKFLYGGCMGNENNFKTLQECNKACVSTTSPPAQNITLRSAPLVTTEKPEDWASTCLLPTDYGPCHNNFSQWYYDKTSGTCKTFIWGGCAGNDNNFDTLDDCIEVCVLTKPKQNSTLRSTPPPPPVISTEVEDKKGICMLPAISGRCLASVKAWYYDKASSECKPFVYGGCGGNENQFATRERCNAVCASTKPKRNSALRPTPPPVISSEVEDRKGICMLPAESGRCFARFKRWYYDKASSKCKPFNYGGCGGNENRFKNLEECNKACSSSPLAQ